MSLLKISVQKLFILIITYLIFKVSCHGVLQSAGSISEETKSVEREFPAIHHAGLSRDRRTEGFFNVSGHIYFISDNVNMRWREALELCSSLGMALWSVETQAELQLLMDFLRPFSLWQYWTSGIHIKSSSSNSSGFLWSGSGQPVNYINWLQGYPANTDKTDDVIAYHFALLQNGFVPAIDVSGENGEYFVICE